MAAMAKSTFISIPFKADGNYGLSESHGVAKFSSAGIIFEFEPKLFGMVGGEVKEVRLGINEILDIKFRRGILKFFASIQIRSKNYAKLVELPNENGKTKLKIKRQDFERAQHAVEQTLQFVNKGQSTSLPESTDLPNRLSPTQTSFNELIDTEILSPEDAVTTKKLNEKADNWNP